MYTTNCSHLFKLLLLLILASSNLPTSRSSCVSECGRVKIPFPFGVGKGCYLEKAYEIECRRKSPTSSSELVPFLSVLGKEVVDIFLADGVPSSSSAYARLHVKLQRGCPVDGKECKLIMNLTSTPFFFDGVNKLAGTGLLYDYTKSNANAVTLGWVIQTKNKSFVNSLDCKNRQDVGDNSVDLRVKCVCDQNTISEITSANCGCTRGYLDIDECKTQPNLCEDKKSCKNIPGSFRCVASKTKSITAGVVASFGVLLVLVTGVWWLRKFLVKTRITKRKKIFFKRNGGLLLQQELNTRQGNVERTRIFSSRELEKATENFSQNRVLGQGGQGTVYKGMLVDGRTVAVKKSRALDEGRVQEFINEVVILSQVNHRHVVKLLGCCLETEVPVLVYEFILNGNLFQHIHGESDDYALIWKIRLRIAVDIAGALSYLHSSASSAIYHRDIKSTNILLDEKYRAKVSDFGTSRSVTIDQTHWTTVISGTVGYVDPEYYRSSQYTEKSDVYSFGVILAELITGDKPVIMVPNTREIICLAEHFRLAMKEKRFMEIVDARIKDDCKLEQVMAVANLGIKCLRLKGKNRPSMREVFSELERICTSPVDPQVQIQIDEEEDEGEEVVMKIINKSDSWTVPDTVPATSMMTSSSSSSVEPLFPRLTW